MRRGKSVPGGPHPTPTPSPPTHTPRAASLPGTPHPPPSAPLPPESVRVTGTRPGPGRTGRRADAALEPSHPGPLTDLIRVTRVP